MATYHGGAGEPLDRDSPPLEHGTNDPSDYNHEDMDNFENVDHENHTTLKALTRNLDDLGHRVETAKRQPMEATNHLEHEASQIVPNVSTLSTTRTP